MSAWIWKRTSNYVFLSYMHIWIHVHYSFHMYQLFYKPVNAYLSIVHLHVLYVYIHMLYTCGLLLAWTAWKYFLLCFLLCCLHLLFPLTWYFYAFRSPSRMKSLFASQYRSHVFNVHFFLIFFFVFFPFFVSLFLLTLGVNWKETSSLCSVSPFPFYVVFSFN